MQVCPSCGEENSDRARFCQACATPLGPAEDARAAEVRKVVTVVFADVTGSTALGERLDPEALHRVIGRYFDGMEAVISAHGGTVEKFIGDAVMAVFGIPRLHEDDALRAVRAADGMLASLADLNLELERDHGVGLEVRIGVNTGEVVASDPSSGQRFAAGDTVNVAARLEQAADPGQILLGAATYRLVKDAVDVEEVEALALKGKADRVPAYRLVGVRADVAGHERHLDSPLVGRAKELALLEQALDRAVSERTSHLFTLLGPAGVGKSRLVAELLASSAPSATVLRGRCLSYGEGITFYPLAEVVSAAAGITDEHTSDDAAARVGALLADAPEGARVAELVGGLLGWGGQAGVDDAFWAVRKLFEHLARDAPLVIVFDDIHWAEPTFLDLIEHLADWTRDAAVLLLGIARPELLEIRPNWAGGKMNATSILLEPLPADDAGALIDNLLGSADIPDAARSRILEAAEGNPLFVEEMIGMLVDDGLLRFEGGTWRAVDDLADLTVPPTIQLLLAARLDRLDAEERSVIERGAVEGKVFHAGAVTSLSPEGARSSVPSRLLALARKELIRPDRADFAGEDAFRFRHLLIRDAAYHAMSKEQRADLHERFAQWLERVAGDRVPEYEEILAYHLERSYRYRLELGPPDAHAVEIGEAAAARLGSSAERATNRGDSAAAIGLRERAANTVEGTSRGRALLTLAWTLANAARYVATRDVAAEAMQLAEAGDDRATWLRANVLRVQALGQTDPEPMLAESTEAIHAALPELEALGDATGVVQMKLSMAQSMFFAGDCAGARAIALGLRDRANTMGFIERRALVLYHVVPAYFGSTPADEALAALDDAYTLLPETPSTVALRNVHLAGCYGMLGRAEESRAAREAAERIYAELGAPPEAMTSRQGLGEAERFLGDPAEAERQFRKGSDALTALGETGFNSTMTALLGAALADQGRYEEASEAVERSRAMGAEDDFATQAAWRMVAARISSARSEHERAVTLAREVIELLEPTDYLAWSAEGYEILGEVLLASGSVGEGRSALAEALSRYERKRVIPSIGRLRVRLEAPSG
jgi:predicted ATPase/class 3 adenylate cyclase